MATGQFYIVYIRPAKGYTLEDLKGKMNIAADWYRIGESIWVLYTTGDAEKWNARLSPLVKGEDDGSLFVCKLDVSDRQGWMTKDFWQWLREER